MNLCAHPILSCHEAAEFEAQIFLDNPDAIEIAMKRAGSGVAHSIIRDYNELEIFPRDPQILTLAGKGHNGGDALIATEEILKARPRGHADVILIYPKSELKPLTLKALESLEKKEQVTVYSAEEALSLLSNRNYHIAIDGILGMSFKGRLSDGITDLINSVNSHEDISFRAAVDIPSALGNEISFQADFTYATGIAKSILFENTNKVPTGRIRYIDLGFFKEKEINYQDRKNIIISGILSPLKKLRSPHTYKNDYGHLFIVGGSRSMPGALAMSVMSALRSGVGLVTAFAPSSMVSSLAARIPEAMWVSWDENDDGFLMQQNMHQLINRLPQATAMLIGPGLGRPLETQGLILDIMHSSSLPTVLDADALQPHVLKHISTSDHPVLLTPHLGEFKRLSENPHATGSDEELSEFTKKHKCFTLLKGPITKITDGNKMLYSTEGGPVLARGGSGDVLSGIIGGLLAQPKFKDDPLRVLAMGACWHGLAADSQARTHGHRATTVTEMIPLLDDVLRGEWI